MGELKRDEEQGKERKQEKDRKERKRHQDIANCFFFTSRLRIRAFRPGVL